MRILDDTPDPALEKKTSCKNCGIRFAYMPADTSIATIRSYDGSSDRLRFLNCPKCGKEMNVGLV